MEEEGRKIKLYGRKGRECDKFVYVLEERGKRWGYGGREKGKKEKWKKKKEKKKKKENGKKRKRKRKKKME